jgi:hypothetical protein
MNIKIVKETKTLQTEVFEAMGETSMCWEPIPTGIFQSTNAENIGRELMLKIQSDIPNAVGALIKALSEDKKEGSYYYSWQANIAMAFKDEWDGEQFQQSDQDGAAVHRLANQAAKNFLDMLCHKVEVEATNS